MNLAKIIIISFAFSILVGCETLPKRDPAFAPVQAVDLRPPQSNNGAIFQAGYDMRLFEDHSARRVGDILTVKLDEETKAKKKADLDASKDNSISVTAPNIAGIDPSILFGRDLSATLASEHEFQGEGQANQSNSLTGDISVTVVDVLPNGNLKIRGEKRMTLNDGSEYIRLSGIVRTIDIDSSNTVSSSKIADATIMYTGDGAVADSSKLGWFAKFFLSPIFPF
ncbi:MAG: flagellar basal body L-ring protein FlgH [Methylococcales bacterium]|nr:flagellar basal body L-ring protein FlgH [Methylococcales bacterium]